MLPFPPSANRYWRHANGHTYKSEDARAYQVAVGWQCQALHLAPHTGPVAVTVRLYRPAKRGDIDNSLKVLLDALQGHVYNDDAQIVELHAYRYDDKRDPRVEVDVESI
jgi:crossover junction endodeoxyribonuclease RusA